MEYHLIHIFEFGCPWYVFGRTNEEGLQREGLRQQAMGGQQGDIGRLRGQQEQESAALAPLPRSASDPVHVVSGLTGRVELQDPMHPG